MYKENFIDKILKSLFSEPLIVNIICSVYDHHLNLISIADRLDIDKQIVENNLNSLIELNLVQRLIIEEKEYFIVTNPKICDSILMLKDAIQCIR